VTYRVTATLVKERTITNWSSQVQQVALFSVISAVAPSATPLEMLVEKEVAPYLGFCLPCLPCLGHGRVRVRVVVQNACLEAGSMCSVVAHLHVRPLAG
jgi:hypothetical protein